MKERCGWKCETYCCYDVSPPGGRECKYDDVNNCPVHNISKALCPGINGL